MKKFLILLLLFILALALVPTALASSGPDTPKVIYEKDPIQDLGELFQRAKKGVTDIDKDSMKPKIEATIVDEKNGKNLEVKVYETTQLIKTVVLKDGTEKNSYMTTAFAILAAEEEDKWDDMDGVRAYSKIYFDRYDDIYCGLYQVTGGWEIQDHQATISNRYLHMGQAGLTQTGYFSDEREYTPTSTFSQSAHKNFPILILQGLGCCG